MTRLALFILTLATAAAPAFATGSWRVTPLDERHIALTGDYSAPLSAALADAMAADAAASPPVHRPDWEQRLLPDFLGAQLLLRHRPPLASLLRDQAPQLETAGETPPPAIERHGFWISPLGLLHYDTAQGEVPTRNALLAYHLFLRFDRPLRDGEELSILLPTGERVRYRHRPQENPSALYKFNQVGYALHASRKYAYLGGWAGTAGPIPLRESYNGRTFTILRSNGTTAFQGCLRPRPGDPYTRNGTPFTGEDVLEIDFSGFRESGQFRFSIKGIGVSPQFSIGDDTTAESFYIHARGLFHKRCGIRKELPYTPWHSGACHQRVYRGDFPPEIRDYAAGSRERPYGFTDAAGSSVTVNPFQLIAASAPRCRESIPAAGGWHDAADYDRRPHHLEIVRDLAAVYLLRPANFTDAQLDIPESGNGIPDLLDEALWGLRHLLAVQRPDGGVGTWFETTRHPVPGEGAPDRDPLDYYASCATRSSTMEYAATAASLALALRQCGTAAALEAAGLLTGSARRAWDFALNPANGATPRLYNCPQGTVFYRENPQIPPQFTLKAALALADLLDDNTFLDTARKELAAALAAARKDSWRWSPLIWTELFTSQRPDESFTPLREYWRDAVIREADRLVSAMEEAYPYRTPWFSPDSPWVHTMAWGTWHPLRRARCLIAAHALTGRNAYLDAARLANDFHNGANPMGSTLTSGLGSIYPVRFLDLASYADGIAEAIPGLTPYRNTYGIAQAAFQLAFGLFIPARRRPQFDGVSLSLLPQDGLTETQCAEAINRSWPVWRRWSNLEGYSTAASEYSVWETIGPAAAVTGYLLEAPLPPSRIRSRRPVTDIRRLPGYAPLP